MSQDIKNILIGRENSIRDTLKAIDKGANGVAIVVNKYKKLVGIITDGDIRRALIKGYKLEDKIEGIIQHSPIYGTVDMTTEDIKNIFIKKAIKQLPIINSKKEVIKIININEILLPKGKDNLVVIMAGGLGTRLGDLTKEIPKPMLNLDGQPILYHIINNFKNYGFNKILISVNYKAEIIENYFQDGSPYGVSINYIKENKRLGTAGGIKLGYRYLNKPFFVINGDILTNLDVEKMMNYHKKNKCDITIGVKKYKYKVPYGVIENDGIDIKSLVEKPELEFLISGGVYCINPQVIDYIPEDTYYEITDLIKRCINEKLKVVKYEIKDYWMDIGKIEDYNIVKEDIKNMQEI